MKRTAIILLSALLFFSCKKDKVVTCTTSTESISGSYKITGLTYKATATTPEVNYLTDEFTDACDRDNVYTFQTNGTYQVKDAGTVCSPSSDDSGDWSFSGNSMTIGGDPSTIESFDCKTLVVLQSDLNITGDKTKITFTKQ